MPKQDEAERNIQTHTLTRKNREKTRKKSNIWPVVWPTRETIWFVEWISSDAWFAFEKFNTWLEQEATKYSL